MFKNDETVRSLFRMSDKLEEETLGVKELNYKK